MKHRQFAKRGLALLLSMVMCMGVFSGCANKKEEEQSVKATASDVAYKKDGVYTTTIKLNDMKFKESVNAEDLKVATTSSAIYNSMKEKEPDIEIDEEKLKSDVKITSASRKDDTTLELSFTDANAADNASVGYSVTIPGKATGKKEDTVVSVRVDTSNKMTCDVKSVTPDVNEIKLTMTLEDDNFASGITAENLELKGAFENMTIASLSSANKNLTVQLTGELKFNETSNTYTNGFVYINKDGFENGYSDGSVSVSVNDIAALFDSATLTVKDGTASADVKIYQDNFTNTDVSAFKIDGATVTGFTKKDATTGTISFTVDGKNNINDIADAVFGKSFTIDSSALKSGKTITATIGTAQASFYPVYDYAEEDGGKYAITLKLYASNGIFATDFSDKQISFADGFKDAKVTSLKRDSDTVATLVISVDSNNVSVEDMELIGTIKLAKGSLICNWGEVADEKEYTRRYSYSEMGKDLSGADIGIIKEIVGGFGNTAFGTFTSVLSGGASVASGVITILEMTGVIESEKAKLDKIYNCLTGMHDEMKELFTQTNLKLDELGAAVYAQNIRTFDSYLNQLCVDVEYCNKLVTNAGTMYKKDHKEPKEKLSYDDDGNCTSSAELQQEWADYCQGYMNFVRQNFNSDNKYTTCIQRIETNLANIASWLNPESASGNVLRDFDTLCSKIYNFDAQSLAAREKFRTTIQMYLVKAKAALVGYYLSSLPDTATGIADRISLEQNMTLINKCNTQIKKGKVLPLEKNASGKEVMYMYVTGRKLLRGVTPIGYEGYENEELYDASDNAFDLPIDDYTCKAFIARMQGRTVAEELKLIDTTANISPNAIIIGGNIFGGSREILHLGVNKSFCTTGFVSSGQTIPKTGETRYGDYAGLWHVSYWFGHYPLSVMVDTYYNVNKDATISGAVDLEHYYHYQMYIFKKA